MSLTLPLLACPPREHLVAADRDAERAHDLDQRGAVLSDFRREGVQDPRGLRSRIGCGRHAPGQPDAAGRAGQVVVEVDAEEVMPFMLAVVLAMVFLFPDGADYAQRANSISGQRDWEG